MKYWLVQINVGTTYFRHSVCIQLEWITWRPSWFSLVVSWIPGQTVGTVNLKPAFLFFFFLLFLRRCTLFCIDTLRGDILRNTPLNAAAELRHNGIPQNPFMSSTTADRKCVKTPTEDYFVILCIVCERKQRVIHVRLLHSADSSIACIVLQREGTFYRGVILIIKRSVFILSEIIVWIQSLQSEPFTITAASHLHPRRMIRGGINRFLKIFEFITFSKSIST